MVSDSAYAADPARIGIGSSRSRTTNDWWKATSTRIADPTSGCGTGSPEADPRIRT